MTRFIRVAALAVLLAAPALAQDTPNSASLGSQIHAALGGDGSSPSAVGALLRDAVNSLGGICTNVQDYQIFRRTPDTDTLKIECSGRPLYLMSVDANGKMLLSGGDGQVQAMERDDGEVVETGATPPPAAAAAPAKPMFKLPGDKNDAIPEGDVEPAAKKPASGDPIENVAVDDTDPRGWTRYAFAGGLATFGLIAFLGYSQLAHAARFARGVQRVGTYTSEEKDKMLAESAELKPDFYIHPSGLFIVRGKRGKRRLFPNKLYAYLYWRYGLKVAQIR